MRSIEYEKNNVFQGQSHKLDGEFLGLFHTADISAPLLRVIRCRQVSRVQDFFASVLSVAGIVQS